MRSVLQDRRAHRAEGEALTVVTSRLHSNSPNAEGANRWRKLALTPVLDSYGQFTFGGPRGKIGMRNRILGCRKAAHRSRTEKSERPHPRMKKNTTVLLGQNGDGLRVAD